MFPRRARFGIALVAMRAEFAPSTFELMAAAMKQAAELQVQHDALKETLDDARTKSDNLLTRHATALEALRTQTSHSQVCLLRH